MRTGEYAAIILAGGLSRRMKRFKPLLLMGEETIADHVITTFLKSGVDVLLVVGHRQSELRSRLAKRDIIIVENPDYRQGMFSSIKAGLRRLEPHHRAFFVTPVDIPLVRPETIRRLRDAATKHPGEIIYPVFGGQRGHPTLIPASLSPVIMRWGKEGGLKAVLASLEERALEVPVDDGNILFDIDTPADYRELLERFRRCQSLIEQRDKEQNQVRPTPGRRKP